MTSFGNTTSIDRENPLITFALFAYNQEQIVHQAIEGAFSQTYSPLEIILSDDCSSDRTFEIMERMTSAYQGPHKVILNRNQKNLGIGRHYNKIMEMAHGEIKVGAAGDDISLPERTQITWEVFRDNPDVMCVTLGIFKFKGIEPPIFPDELEQKNSVIYYGISDYISILNFPWQHAQSRQSGKAHMISLAH